MKTQWHICNMGLELPCTSLYMRAVQWVKIKNIYIFKTEYVCIPILHITEFLLAFIRILLVGQGKTGAHPHSKCHSTSS